MVVEVQKMTIEELCEKVGVKGLITYYESEDYLAFTKNCIEYIYNKKTENLIVIDHN